MTEVLRIWGVDFELRGATEAVLDELREEFFGAVAPVAAAGPTRHRINFVPGRIAGVQARRLAPRHRGGSSGDKTMVDGTPFVSAAQQRDAGVVEEGREHAVYDLDGVVACCSRNETTLLGDAPPYYVASDLVENVILATARAQGWLQVHGAAWMKHGVAHVRLGASGAGKTTSLFRELHGGAVLLGNDRVFVRQGPEALEVRGFPLAINVGCGTIRALNLDLPHFDMPDTAKVRLTARQVHGLFETDFQAWWPIASVQGATKADLREAVYVEPDPCHPDWNAATRISGTGRAAAELLRAIEEMAAFSPLIGQAQREATA